VTSKVNDNEVDHKVWKCPCALRISLHDHFKALDDRHPTELEVAFVDSQTVADDRYGSEQEDGRRGRALSRVWAAVQRPRVQQCSIAGRYSDGSEG
jgi:hypothetical protein